MIKVNIDREQKPIQVAMYLLTSIDQEFMLSLLFHGDSMI